MTESEDKNRRRLTLVTTYVTLPFVLAIPPIIGWWIGLWLDRHLGTAPWLMFFMLVVGMIAGIREFYRIVKKYGKGGNEQ